MSNNYILFSNGAFASTDDLCHYGVVGMKWGVRRAARLESRNERLARKALKYDIKSAKFAKKSEKRHAEEDLQRANRAATKGAKYLKKAATVRKKALKGSEYEQLRAERKASKLEYKAAKKVAKGNRLSKTVGYGAKAMNYSIKSDKFATKAAKARSKMARNKAYSAMMDKRLSSLDADKRRKVEESFVKNVGNSVSGIASRSTRDKNK